MPATIRPLAALVVLGTLAAAPAAAQRQRLSLDAGWQFTLGDPAGAEVPGFDARNWRTLDLPHDWSIEGTPAEDAPGGGRIGFFPTGIGWYRKVFRLPRTAKGQQVSVEFDGIYMNSDVWLNGVHLGQRPYGYISLAYDLTPHLKPGDNVLAVRVDNSAQPSSRWYTGSGIYRHTWLTITDPLHLERWGTWVATPSADTTRGVVVVRGGVRNDGVRAREATLRWLLLDPQGAEVGRVEQPFSLAPGSDTTLERAVELTRPRLWSPADPALYTLRSEVVEGRRVTDATETTFGVRTAAFDADRGFLLNGERVKLRGVNLHHEAGALGAAVPERVWEVRLQALQAMGVNAIRTSHNPPAPEFLDLCDRLGLMVMDEAFDEWTLGKVPAGYHNYFDEWADRDVTDMVRRDRGHPSVVLWSAGNEIGEQTTPDGVGVLQRLLQVFHREDPTRLVTTGNDNIAADGHPATLAFLNALDVVGYNYVDRWHERRELFAEEDRAAHPAWKMIGTESGTIFQSFDEAYSLGDDPAVARANYTSGMIQAERLWKWITLHDYFSGNFMWTGIDYLGEATWPFKGFGSGALDITNRPKDGYYLYQSLWTDQPVLHLLPHWTWPGREGQSVPVLAYSSCNTVELFLNGRSLGEQRKEFPAQGTSGGWNSYAEPVIHPTTADLHFRWDVPYEPGVLRAVGKRRDGAIVCEDEVRTAGPAVALRLVPDRDSVTTGAGDVALVRFEVVDSAGTVVPTVSPEVSVTVAGATLVALDNADLRDLAPYRTGHRAAYQGRGLAIIRATVSGPITVTATSPGLAQAEASLRAVAGASR